MEHLRELEVALHQSDIRTNIDKLTKLIHPAFVEIGYSGKTYDFKAVLKSMSELPPFFVIWSQDFEYSEYAEGVVQVTYLSANIDQQGNLSRHAKRTSIWVNETGNWQMKFHQATPVPTFDKSKASLSTDAW